MQMVSAAYYITKVLCDIGQIYIGLLGNLSKLPLENIKLDSSPLGETRVSKIVTVGCLPFRYLYLTYELVTLM